jgi:hypothetical protein
MVGGVAVGVGELVGTSVAVEVGGAGVRDGVDGAGSGVEVISGPVAEEQDVTRIEADSAIPRSLNRGRIDTGPQRRTGQDLAMFKARLIPQASKAWTRSSPQGKRAE